MRRHRGGRAKKAGGRVETVVVVDDEDDSNADAMDVKLLVVVGLDWFVR